MFEIVWNEGGDPRAIVEQRGLQQMVDVSAIEALVDEIIGKIRTKSPMRRRIRRRLAGLSVR